MAIPWGDIAGAGVGGAFELGSSALQYGYNKKLQKDAQKFAIFQMKNKYQYMVKDLISAGINPLMAVRGGLSGSAASPSIGSGVSKPDFASAAKLGALVKKQLGLLGKDVEHRGQQVERERNQTTLLEAEESLLRQEMPYFVERAKQEMNSAGQIARAHRANAEAAELALPGLRALSSAQSTQKHWEAVRFQQEVQPYAEPWKGLVNVGVGGFVTPKGRGRPRRR